MHRVTVLDPDRMTREALTRALACSRRIQVVHTAGGLDAADRIPGEDTPPDVVVATRAFPDPELIRLGRRLWHRGAPPALVVTDLPAVESLILRFIEAGAAGYVCRGEGAERMVSVVESVARAETRIPDRMTRRVIERLTELTELCRERGADPTLLRTLTPREAEVLALVSEGLSNPEIGRHLSVASGTVKSHVHRILEKLRVTDRDEAARYFRLCSSDSVRATAR